MKKKLSVLLCAVTVMLCFTACGGSKEQVQYDEGTVTQIADGLIENCNGMDDATVEEWKNMSDFKAELILTQYGVPYTRDSFVGAIESWSQAKKDCGEFVSRGDYEFEASADELKVTANAEFTDRDAKITFVFDENLCLDSLTVDAKYSTGEIMEKAGLNTILGMGTVFVVLIFISILISLFKYIPLLEAKLKKQPAAEKKEVSTSAEVSVAAEEDLTDDLELVAVIAAAIAAAEGAASTDGFVVRSIRRRPSNKWRA